MPNGGLTPDCVHCKHYQGKPLSDREPYCNCHKIGLASPIRVFCSRYVDPEPDGVDWLDQELDRQQLQADMMYVWLGENTPKFFHVPLTPIAEYQAWTWEQFLEEVARLVNQE